MTTTTIRVDDEVRARIADRSRAEGKPMSDVLTDALNALDSQEFWAGVRRTMMTPEARNDLKREVELLGGSSGDGLGEAEDWSHLQ